MSYKIMSTTAKLTVINPSCSIDHITAQFDILKINLLNININLKKNNLLFTKTFWW